MECSQKYALSIILHSSILPKNGKKHIKAGLLLLANAGITLLLNQNLRLNVIELLGRLVNDVAKETQRKIAG